jgi:Fe2+ transport system protein B
VKEMNTGILIISVLAAMISIVGDPQIGYGNALNVLNTTNTNTTNVNGAGGNATVPDTQTGSVSEDDETGNIVDLPGKCLGSALCPD